MSDWREEGGLTHHAEQLLRDMLALTADERARVAAELLASLEDDPDEDTSKVRAAWASEIETRAQDVLAGRSVGEPWEAVRSRVAHQLTER